MPFLLGSAYAVSAGLIVYAIERDYISREDAFKYIVGWAVAGLVLALAAVIARREER